MKKIILALSLFCLGADYQTKNRPDFPANRSSTTNSFGNGTMTRRSDGSYNYTRPFGSSSITTESNKGKTVTGITQPFGNGTITRWSDGRTTTTNKFGSGQTIKEYNGSGKTASGIVQPFGNGSQTRWSNGATNTNTKFGSGSINNDKK